LKKAIIVLLITVFIAGSITRVKAVSYVKIDPCCLAPLGCLYILTYPFISLYESYIGMRDRRTYKIYINGKEAQLLRRTVSWHDKRRNIPEKGILANEVTVGIQGEEVVIGKGHIAFHKNGELESFNGYGYFHKPSGGKVYVKAINPFDSDVNNILSYRRLNTETMLNISLDEEGKLRSFPIEDDGTISIEIQGKSREVMTYAEFNENGQIKSCVLANNETLIHQGEKIAVPAGSRVAFYDNLNILTIDSTFSRGTYSWFRHYRGEKHYAYSKGREIKAGTFTFSLLGKRAVLTNIKFYPDGKVADCRLFDTTRLSLYGRLIPLEGIITFYPDGSVNWCTIAERTPFKAYGNELLCSASGVNFHPSGLFKSCLLATPVKIRVGRNSFETSTSTLEFHENGGVSEIWLGRKQWYNHGDYSLYLLSKAEFYENGTLKKGGMKGPAEISVEGFNIHLLTNDAKVYVTINPDGSIDSFYYYGRGRETRQIKKSSRPYKIEQTSL